MKNNAQSFGDMIRDARIAHQPPLSQQGLADMLGVRQSTVSAWELEVARPKTPVLVELSSVLSLDLSKITTAAAVPAPGPTARSEVRAQASR